MKKLVTKKTTVKSLFENTPFLKYKNEMYYGWDTSNDHRTLISLIADVWPNEETIEGLNKICELDKEGQAKIIPYSKTNNELNFVALLQKEKAKVVIVAAGGGYSCVCTATEALPIAIYLFNKGYSVFMMNYGILEKCRFGQATKDIADGINYLFAHQNELNVDMNDYMIGGFSAGGHAVAELLTDNFGFKVLNVPVPKLMFLGYPVITMHTQTHGGSRICLFGDKLDYDTVDVLSVESHLVNQDCKVFHWQCQRDNTVPFENTILFRKALKENNYNFISEDFDSDAHGWGIATGKLAEGWLDRMLEFADK